MRPRILQQNTNTKTNKKTKPHKGKNNDDSPEDDESAFETPDPDNETDYGLEFTTSRLAKLSTSHRRCSTLRKNSEKENVHETHTSEDSSNDENRPSAVETRRNSPQKSAQNKGKGVGKSKPVAHQPADKTSRRKRYNPEHRMKKLNREIERLQKHPGFIIPRLPFSRLVREILMEYAQVPFKITATALEAIQCACEMYLTQRFEDAYLLTQYRGRVTLEVRDMAMVAYFCRIYGNI